MPLSARTRADELDAALSSGRVPAQADGLARELAVVAALRTAGQASAAAPTEEFRTALRQRLVAVAAVQGVGETARAPVPSAVSWRQRAATVAAGVMASVVAVTGVSVAASRSLPGDPFYGVKRTVEDVQLRLADGPQEEGERHLQFAATRMRELRQLAFGRDLADRDGDLTASDAARVRELLDDMDAETRTAAQLLTGAFRDSRDAEPLRELARFADRQRAGLQQVLPVLPAAATGRAAQSLTLVTGLGATADELLGLVDCTAACDPSASAPVLPDPSAPAGTPGAAGPCSCPTQAPQPSVAPAPSGGPSQEPAASGSSAPAPSAEPSPAPSTSRAPAPAPSPSASSAPLPLPVPVPVPSLPVPVPTLPPLPGLDPQAPVQVPPLPGVLNGALDGLLGVAPAVVPGGGTVAVVVRLVRGWH